MLVVITYSDIGREIRKNIRVVPDQIPECCEIHLIGKHSLQIYGSDDGRSTNKGGDDG